METRLTLRPGMPGTKKLASRYGERLVCVRYLYDEARGRRLKTVELVIEDAPWQCKSRKPRRDDHDLVGVRVAWNDTDLRIAVRKAGSIWRPRQKLWELSWDAVRALGIAHRVVESWRQSQPKRRHIAAYSNIYPYRFAYTRRWF